MMDGVKAIFRVAWACGALAVVACQPRTAGTAAADSGTPRREVKPAPPASAPAAAPAESAGEKKEGMATFSSDKLGITFALPAGWVKKENKDYELMLVPEKGGAEGTELTLDVPDLPPHVPGMIPIGSVRNGYVDDLKKAHPAVTVKDEPVTVAGAKAKRVEVIWKKDGVEYQDTAVLMVHGDRVYILRAASAAKDADQVREAFDGVVKTVGWKKK